MSGQGKNEEPENRPNQYQNITTENLSQSAVSYGGDATVTIHQHFEAPKPPRPDYINMAPDLKHFVERPHEYNQLRDSLISPNKETVAISAALRGAGGFGKTTLAQRLCYDEAVQQTFPDGILWVELGERPDNLVSKVNDLTDVLTGGRPTVVELNAAAAELAYALGEKRCLMVIDDLWNAAHAVPFLRGGPNCTRLITTRNADTLPVGVESINVDAMRKNEALAMLVRELPGWEPMAESFAGLVTRLGEWPLLLKLANSALYRRAAQQGLEKALAYVDKALEKRGLRAFDAKNPASRGQAVAATLGVSLAELDEAEQNRFQELAVFPEDYDVPLLAVASLWSSTGGLDDFDTEELCTTLYDRSLLLRWDGRSLRLHDVVRQYLLVEWGETAETLHQQLLDAYNPTADWSNGPNDGYYFQNLAYHLKEAGKTADLRTFLFNFTWLQTKLYATSINDLLTDYQVLEQLNRPLELVEGALRLSSHIVEGDKDQLAFQLRGRLLFFKDREIKSLCEKADEIGGVLRLTPLHPCLTISGGPLVQTVTGHTALIRALAVTKDGQQMISASDDGTIKVWNIETWKVDKVLEGRPNLVLAIAVTPSGRQLVTALDNGNLDVWNLQDGKLKWTLLGHSGSVRAVAITPDGLRAVSASDDQTLKVWNLNTGEINRTLVGHSASVRGVAFSPNGRQVVSASDDRTLKVWNLETGEINKTLIGHSASVRSVAVTPDGRRVVSASEDRTVKIWDIEIGIVEKTLEGHSSYVNEVAITSNGRTVVSASDDQTLKVWELETGLANLTLEGHSSFVNATATIANSLRVLSASDDQTIKVWNIATKEIPQVQVGHTRWTQAVFIIGELYLENKYVISASRDGTVKMWNSLTRVEEWTYKVEFTNVLALAVTPDNRTAILALSDGSLKILDLEIGKEKRTLQKNSSVVHAIAVTPYGRQLISASDDRKLKIWDLETGRILSSQDEISSSIQALAVTPDGRYLILADWDGILKVWNLEKDVEEAKFEGHTAAVNDIAFTHNGTRLISASDDRTLKVWNLDTGIVEQTLIGHTDRIMAVAVTKAKYSETEFLVSASSDGKLNIWDIEDHRVLATYDLDQPPTCLAIDNDGDIIVVGDQAGHVFWLALRTS